VADPGILVVATDLATGDTSEVLLKPGQPGQPGQHVTICAEPLYVAHEQRHANGTVVLTLKRRSPEEADHG
jgi:hypothetical protein